MREIKKGDTTFKVRGLTRGEVKELRRDGIDLADLGKDNAEGALDRVFDLVLTSAEQVLLDDLVYFESLDVFSAIMAETYGSRDEEKNLPPSGNGTQTESG